MALSIALFSPLVILLLLTAFKARPDELEFISFYFYPLIESVIVTMILYGVYRIFMKSAPRRHKLFIGISFGLGLLIVYRLFVANTHGIVHPAATPPGGMAYIWYFAQCAAGYALYRKAMTLTDKARQKIGIAVVITLIVLLGSYEAYRLHRAAVRPCAPDEIFMNKCSRN
ncbi:MAG: hypothetical protein ACAH83_17310 [Alphaproteobacteria bacterium]